MLVFVSVCVCSLGALGDHKSVRSPIAGVRDSCQLLTMELEAELGFSSKAAYTLNPDHLSSLLYPNFCYIFIYSWGRTEPQLTCGEESILFCCVDTRD